jgi:polysaccharide pyruvyl transferase WcaK-like protein
MSFLPRRVKTLVYGSDWLRRHYLRAQLWHGMRKIAAAWSDLPAAGTAKSQPETYIFSRYGTETVGNQFIQLGLLRVCFQTNPARPVNLLSAAPHVTQKGLDGMLEILSRTHAALPLARFISEKVTVLKKDGIRSLGRGDLLVLGGGPIMDDPMLTKWKLWFQWAQRAGAHILIAGCGLGPLRRKKTTSIAESLLKIANTVVLRNNPEPNFVRAAKGNHVMALDPAFLCAALLPLPAASRKHLLAVNARLIAFDSNPGKNISADEVVACAVRHALSVAEFMQIEGVVPFSTQEDVDSADSQVAVRAAQQIAESLRVPLLALPEASIPGIVDGLSQAEFVLSTRMHGFILGMLLGCRAAGLDYIANGGKCTDLYRDWFGRYPSPSFYLDGSLHGEDFVSICDLVGASISDDMLLGTYANAMRQALAQ